MSNEIQVAISPPEIISVQILAPDEISVTISTADQVVASIQPMQIEIVSVLLNIGPRGDKGDSGTTTWAGITDKPDFLILSDIFSGLAKITVGNESPDFPVIGDLWVDTS